MLFFIFIILITSIGQSLFAASPSKENPTTQKTMGPLNQGDQTKEMILAGIMTHRLYTSMQTVLTAHYDLSPGNNGFSLNNFDEIKLLCDNETAQLQIFELILLVKPLPDKNYALHLIKSNTLNDLTNDRFDNVNKKLFIFIKRLYPDITITNKDYIIFNLMDAFNQHSQEEQKDITPDMSAALIDNIVRNECIQLFPIEGIKKLIRTYYYYSLKRTDWDKIFHYCGIHL